MNETIAAIATAHGIGGIAIVRLSGDSALDIALKITRAKALEPRYATLLKFYDSKNELIDEGIVIYYKAPHSFSGEDVVEFQTHGGLIVSNLLLDELVRLGARIAAPGEFSKRAFLNGKMDLSKAEAVQSLILARSESAAKILARSLRGELADFVENLRAALVKTLAFVEVCIDYAEEDLPADVLQSSQKMLGENISSLKRIVEISRRRKGLIDGFKVAIVGKPNVGKSSILNALLSYERAIVSDEAGTTRDRIEESLKIGTHLIRIIDTAGIRDGSSKIESIGISHSIKAIAEADIILAVFDASAPFDEQDGKILEILNSSGVRPISACDKEEQASAQSKKIFYVLNKCDLPRKFDLNFIVQSARKSQTHSNLDAQNFSDGPDGKNLSGSEKNGFCESVNVLQSLVHNDSAGKTPDDKSLPDKSAACARVGKDNSARENSDEKSPARVSAKENFSGESFAAAIEISAKKGVDKIFAALQSYLNSQNFDGLMLNSDRQIRACESALDALQNADKRLGCGELEIFAFEINRAIAEISSISRPFERSEILDEMFGNFCLGK